MQAWTARANSPETEDELMKHVQLHGAEAHPDLEITPELAEQIQKLVRTV